MLRKFYLLLLVISNFTLLTAKETDSLGMVPDQGTTSELHKNNIGKILWSDRRIKLTHQDDVNFFDTFDNSCPLYGRVFLQASVYNLSVKENPAIKCLNTESHYELTLTIDGVDHGVFFSSHFFDKGWTTVQINLNLQENDFEDLVNQGSTIRWTELVNNLSKGEHKIEFSFRAGKDSCKKTEYAKGSFRFFKN